MVFALSISISILAIVLAGLRMESLRSLRGFMVLFALGAGQIHLAILSLIILLFSEEGYSLPRHVSLRSVALLLGFFFAVVSVTLFSDIRERTISELLQLLLYIFTYIQLQSVLRQSGQMERLVRLSVPAAMAVAILGLVLERSGLTEAPAIFLDRGGNEGSTFLLLMGVVPSVFMFLKNRNLVYILCIFMLTFVQLEATSRANVALSALCFLAIGFFIWKDRLPRVVLSLIVVAALYVNIDFIEAAWDQQQNYSALERTALYEAGIKLWLDSPWIGWGWGATSELVPRIVLTGSEYPHFHSTYIQFIVELGVLGVLIAGLWIIVAFAIMLYGAFGHFRQQYAAYLVLSSFSLLSSGFTEAMIFGADRAIQVVFISAFAVHIIVQARYQRRRMQSGHLAVVQR